MSFQRLLRACVVLAAMSGCRTYEEASLRPEEVLARVDAVRRLAAGGAGERAPEFTIARAAELLAEHGPALRIARAEYATALGLADVDTPLPNPSLEVGPSYGFGADVESNRLQPLGSLGFALPIGGRLGRQDDVNRLKAGRAQVELRVAHREAYLSLRRSWTRLALARRRLVLAAELTALAASAADGGRRLVEAGQATALDRSLLDLDLARVEAQAHDAEAEAAAAEGELAELLGVHAEHFRAPQEMPVTDLPAAPPTLEDLKARLVANHPGLARLRSDYDVAEGELRLEIAKQYPDIRFGASAEGDPGERKYVVGLTLGIDVPLFDRNEQAIAAAEARREEIRAKYEAEAASALARLERAHARAGILTRKLSAIRGKVVVAARRQLDLAVKSLEAGAADALRVLEAERAFRDVMVEAIETETEAREAWADLEESVGRPLLLFPGELEEKRPPEPYREPEETGCGSQAFKESLS
ncbi:MAG: TolC family protein [Planctomycetes bacterium]|nr:TolC family protein [Planctomycetota bacterium]